MPPRKAAAAAAAATPATSKPPPRARKAPQKPAEDENKVSDAVESSASEGEEEKDDIESVVEEEDTRRGRQKKGTATTAPPAKGKPTTRTRSKPPPKGKHTTPENEEDSVAEENTPRRSKRDASRARPAKEMFRPPSPPVVSRKRNPAPSAKNRNARKPLEKPSVEREIKETQFDPVVISEDELAGEGDSKINGKKRALSGSTLPPAKRNTNARNHRQQSEEVAEEDGNAVARIVDNTRSPSPPAARSTAVVPAPITTISPSDSAIQRQVEKLQQKITELSALRLTDPEKALEEYKTVMEARLKAAEKLNVALQETSKSTKKVHEDAATLRKQLASKDVQIGKDATTIAALEKQCKELTAEVTSLTAKLATARAAPPPQQHILGSAMKPKHPGSVASAINAINGITSSSSSSITAAWTQKAKEELYSDLSGVSILDVKETKDDPQAQARIYTCLLTGLNGSLHFKLTTPLAFGSGEDMITFTPMLDLATGRDTKVWELLPEYMREEIGFSRTHTTRFFLRVLDVMMTPPDKRLGKATLKAKEGEEEEEDEEEEEEEEEGDGETSEEEGDEEEEGEGSEA
ncbi:hypothetical protein DFH27DRAFT_123986 [Peziza echinospora]|nr:hypothetical protein DFH27DRAFT_123986 [Peziza echinospora]